MSLSLSHEDVSRVLFALVEDFQAERLANHGVDQKHTLKYAAMRQKSVQDVSLDEETLGLDSLALIDLVTDVSKFFNLSKSGIDDYLLIRRKFGDWVELILEHFKIVGKYAVINFKTSGSTGSPKHVGTTWAHLEEEVCEIRKLFCRLEKRPKRLLSGVSPHHIFGFIWSVLLPNSLNIQALEFYHKCPTWLFENSSAGDLIVATPFFWEKYCNRSALFPEDCFSVVSGSRAGEDVWQRISALGIEYVLEVYGSTETGGVGIRESNKKSFQLLGHLELGESRVKRKSDGTHLSLQDCLIWTGEKEFDLGSRIDNKIQIAGTNIDIDEIKRQLSKVRHIEHFELFLEDNELHTLVWARQSEEVLVQRSLYSTFSRFPATYKPRAVIFSE